MKKTIKFPTVIGLFFLVLVLIVGIFLIRNRVVFNTKAELGTNPQNVRISNIKSESVTVSWTTSAKTSGFVKWGKNQTSLNETSRDEIPSSGNTHWTTIKNLNPNEIIHFKIGSNNKEWDNNGTAWNIKTSSETNNEKDNSTYNMTGKIITPTGENSSYNLVYLTINGNLFSTFTSQEGNWVVLISNSLNIDPEKTIVEISADNGVGQSTSAIIYPKVAQNTPVMVMGKTYDFRNAKITPESKLPEGNVSVPEGISISSRFEIDVIDNQANNNVVTLESIDNNEIITTTNPEFFGEAPQNKQLEITVESEIQSSTVTPNNNGLWNWSPPNNLEEGEHTITVKWQDENGIIRTIIRNFIVQAGESPAFESTPSATPVLILPTNTPEAGVTASSSPTTIPIPDTGALTPTLGLFIMGLGILISSIFLLKTANG